MASTDRTPSFLSPSKTRSLTWQVTVYPAFKTLGKYTLFVLILIVLVVCLFQINFALQSRSGRAKVVVLHANGGSENAFDISATKASKQLFSAVASLNGPAKVSSFAALAATAASVAELLSEGGVYIYNSNALLEQAGATARHFHFSGSPRPQWIEGYDQYALEEAFIRFLQASPFVTTDPTKAKLFFVPHYSVHETHYCTFFDPRKPGLKACAANVTRDYLMPIITAVQATPYWNRSNGRDHVWLFPWDAAWALFPGVPAALANSSYLGYYKNSSSAIIVPVPVPVSWSAEETTKAWLRGGGEADHTSAHLVSAQSREHDIDCPTAPKTKYLASFFGTVHSEWRYSHGVRQDLLELLGDGRGDEDRILFVNKHVPSTEYAAALKDSIFCLSPPGWTPWSQRLYSAISAGCVPVFFEIRSFNMWLPFEDIVQWRSFSITIPEGKHKDVASILKAIPPAEVCRLRAELAHWAPYLMWSSSPDLTLMFVLRQAWERVKRADGT